MTKPDIVQSFLYYLLLVTFGTGMKHKDLLDFSPFFTYYFFLLFSLSFFLFTKNCYEI